MRTCVVSGLIDFKDENWNFCNRRSIYENFRVHIQNAHRVYASAIGAEYRFFGSAQADPRYEYFTHFKFQAIQEAFDAGFERVIWLDFDAIPNRFAEAPPEGSYFSAKVYIEYVRRVRAEDFGPFDPKEWTLFPLRRLKALLKLISIRDVVLTNNAVMVFDRPTFAKMDIPTCIEDLKSSVGSDQECWSDDETVTSLALPRSGVEFRTLPERFNSDIFDIKDLSDRAAILHFHDKALLKTFFESKNAFENRDLHS